MVEFRADGFSTGTENGKAFLRFAVSDNSFAERIVKDKPLTVRVSEYREKRTLDQNALYWKCLTMLASALRISNAETHNMMLRLYGQLERYGDKLVYVVLPDTEEAREQADRAETYHLKPTSETRTGKDGDTYRTWLLLRGSSTYDTAEFSRLLDGLLSECADAGVEVLTERERSLLDDERVRTSS